tara:strand:- start:7252 stop:7761 length:510 start_codon:yes stop_codon:yes gene_type:complete
METLTYPGEIKNWGRPTTHGEKAELLGEDRIIKAVYWQDDGDGSSRDYWDTESLGLYCTVAPLSYEVIKKNLAAPLEVTRKELRRFELATHYPTHQEPGSLSPFILPEDAEKVRAIIFHDLTLRDIVDFAYPGDKALSILLRYDEAFEHLKEQFPKLVSRADIARSRNC